VNGGVTVSGSTDPQYFLNSSGGNQARFKINDASSMIQIGSWTNIPVGFYTNGTERMRIQTGGFTLNPATNNLYQTSGALSYYGTTNNVYLNGASSGGMIMSGNGNRYQYVYLNSVSDSVMITTNTVERLGIDSSGRVTMPYQPSFSCYKNGTLTETSGYTRVGSWTENHDQGGHFDNSTGRFTAPVSGKYFFAFSAMHSGNVNGDVQFNIYKNGGPYQGSNDTADGSNWDQCTVVAVVAMAANDYVEPYAYSNTTSTRELVYSGRYSGWHGYLIG
jgi:hypothetical protein